MVLVIGGSGSGKSAYAESAADSLAQEGCGKYYLATMQAFDGEGRRRVERHRSQRSGKGFRTVEQPTDICRALGRMEGTKRVVLLECILNLTANEMFAGQKPRPEGLVVETVIRGVEALQAATLHLVVVSGNVFEDGVDYDAATMAYIRAMGEINRRLAGMADQVVEVAVGIPIILKQ